MLRIQMPPNMNDLFGSLVAALVLKAAFLGEGGCAKFAKLGGPGRSSATVKEKALSS